MELYPVIKVLAAPHTISMYEWSVVSPDGCETQRNGSALMMASEMKQMSISVPAPFVHVCSLGPRSSVEGPDSEADTHHGEGYHDSPATRWRGLQRSLLSMSLQNPPVRQPPRGPRLRSQGVTETQVRLYRCSCVSHSPKWLSARRAARSL